jgi:hypothetical protein
MKLAFALAACTTACVILVGGQNASASALNSCVNEYVSSYVQASRGKYPPSGQAKKYCTCALSSVASGDSMATAAGMCTQMIRNLYGLN